MSLNNASLPRLLAAGRLGLAAAAFLCLLGAVPAFAGEQSARVASASQSSLSRSLLSLSRPAGRVDADQAVDIAFVLPLRNQSSLDDLLKRLYDPSDPLYGRFLTPSQFADRFGPCQSDFDSVRKWAESAGLKVVQSSPTRNLLVARGSARHVEEAFQVHLDRYRLPNGRIAYANGTDPLLPEAIASRIVGVSGLDNLAVPHPTLARRPEQALSVLDRSLINAIAPRAPGNGPAGGFTPSDLKTAYGVGSTFDGTGMSAAVLELDGYKTSDVTRYTQQFNLPSANLQNVLLGGFDGSAGADEIEVVLDIDMILAIAPNLQKLYVYEAQNSGTAIASILNRMAADNLAPVISISWGEAEQFLTSTQTAAESQALQQLSAQGQTVCAASGDAGAYDDARLVATPTLSVDDPGVQPTVLACGGTKLTTTGAGGPYASETVWKGTLADAATNGGGSGGGISTVWTKPTYQAGGVGQTAVGESPTQRDVPDVAIDADPNTGEDIYLADFGGWVTGGGTSAAAPLWAGFFALANQARLSTGLAVIGTPHAAIYAIGRDTATYAKTMHDITTGDNLFYNAKVGFDDATGWGSFNGDPLIAQLAPVQKRGTLAGTVSDADGIPLEGATVTVRAVATNGLVGTATAASDGTYTIKVPAGVALTATASLSGFARQTFTGLTSPEDGSTTQNFTLQRTHRFSSGVQMISAPFEFTGVGSFAALFGLSTPPASGDPRFFIWQSAQNNYVGSPLAPADTMHLGMAYWVRFSQPTDLQLAGSGAPSTLRVTLQPGWNQIGDPYAVSLPIASVLVDNLTAGSPTPIGSSSQIRLPLYSYNQVSGAYDTIDSTGTLAPWTGYWIFANQSCVLVFNKPS